MFLDDRPLGEPQPYREEPQYLFAPTNRDTAWFLSFLGLTVFFATIHLAADYTGQVYIRDSALLLEGMFGFAALCVFAAMFMNWYSKRNRL